jgi:hypothetical protein
LIDHSAGRNTLAGFPGIIDNLLALVVCRAIGAGGPISEFRAYVAKPIRGT